MLINMSGPMKEAYEQYKSGALAHTVMAELLDLYKEQLLKYVEAEVSSLALDAEKATPEIVKKVKEAAAADEAALADTQPAQPAVHTSESVAPVKTAAPENIPVDPGSDTAVPAPPNPSGGESSAPPPPQKEISL